jgi:hypothetical protein
MELKVRVTPFHASLILLWAVTSTSFIPSAYPTDFYVCFASECGGGWAGLGWVLPSLSDDIVET